MKLNKLILFISIITFPASLPADAADSGILEIKAAVNPGIATIGGKLQYTVSIAGENIKGIKIKGIKEKIFYPAPKKSVKKNNDKKSAKEEKKPSDSVPLYIIHNQKKEDNSDESMTYVTINVTLSFYRPGKHRLPEVEILGKDNIKIGYRVPEVEIRSVNKKGEYQEIEPPLELGGNYTRIMYIIIATVLLTMFAVFIVKYIKKRKAQKDEIPVVIPAIDVFLKGLEELAPGNLIHEGRIEEYIVGISMIFRKFLSLQFSFDATEMTSDEINGVLKKIMPQKVYNRYIDLIMRNFNLWDLSKFAEFTPSGEVLLINYEETERLALNISKDMDNDSAGI